jgi:autonomous glycyl radical cofactor GrcA
MANLKFTIAEAIEELFDMKSGYVLDFSNNSFQRFIKRVINVDIYNDEGYKEYCSKANKLRQIFEIESNQKVAKLIIALLDYCEDYLLKNSELTEYKRKKISDIKREVEELTKDNRENVVVTEALDELIQKISTRNARFNEMAPDEKLKEIGNLIENLLKKDGRFIVLNYEDISLGFIKDINIKEYRRHIQCFRHSSEESISERDGYNEKQKRFMVEYGIVICNLIYSKLKAVEE